VAALAAAIVFSVTGCGRDVPASAPTASPQGASSVPANASWWTAMARPTGLRVLIDGRLIDVDAGIVAPREVSERLLPVAGPPIFIVRSDTGLVGPARLGPAKAVGHLPDSAKVLLVKGAHFQLAASVEGRSVWISEYLDRTRCAIRELWLDGRTKRPSRGVSCGVEPVAQTEAGLWVKRGKNWFASDRHVDELSEREPTFALLDPDTLAERATYPEVRILGRGHVLTFDDEETTLVLRAPNRTVSLEKPSAYTSFVFNGHRPVVPVSPDGRYAIVRFGSHGQSPQILDVWVLDLANAAWLHVPGMPTEGALKYTSEAWALDGRLVMVGRYGTGKPIFGAWRPGDANLAVLTENRVPMDIFDQGFPPIYAW
jgi:hypothetical protein